MWKAIDIDIDEQFNSMVTRRRDFHKYAESGWVEYRTTSIIWQYLEDLGFTIYAGKELFDEESRLGVPAKSILMANEKRALEQGANPKHMEKMTGGYTGVIGEIDTKKEGPTIILRFDIDSNDGVETMASDHRPVRDAFRSVNEGFMHCCGHDGHATMGMEIARLLKKHEDKLTGKIRIIFQPAEEGVRGAHSMVKKGWLDDADYFLAGHLGFVLEELGHIILDARGFLSTSKLDATFIGETAHAGADPQKGKNALLAACTATLNMQSFLQHSGGATRLNVGVLEAGTGRNVVPGGAKLYFETRGIDNEVNEYVRDAAIRVVKAAGAMYDCQVEIKKVGEAQSASSSDSLAKKIQPAIEDLIQSDVITKIEAGDKFSGSEDATFMMNKVQENGGEAVYMIFGTPIAAGHHNSSFDFDEKVMPLGVKIFMRSIIELAGKK